MSRFQGKCIQSELIKRFFMDIYLDIKPIYLLTVGFYPPKGVCRNDLDLSRYMRNSDSEMCAFNRDLVRGIRINLFGKYRGIQECCNIVSIIEDIGRYGVEKKLPHIHALVDAGVSEDFFKERIDYLINFRLANKYGVPFYYDIRIITDLKSNIYKYPVKNINIDTNLDRIFIYKSPVLREGVRASNLC